MRIFLWRCHLRKGLRYVSASTAQSALEERHNHGRALGCVKILCRDFLRDFVRGCEMLFVCILGS